MGISTAAPSQLFPDSHENLILLGKSLRLLKAGGLGMDFFLADCPSLLPEAPSTSCRQDSQACSSLRPLSYHLTYFFT